MNNILMNTEMALAILDGRKTQTRRVVPKHIEIIGYDKGRGFVTYSNNGSKTHDTFSVDEFISDFSKYKKDEVIWVREPAKITKYISRFDSTKIDYQLKADKNKEYRIDVPPRFLPNPKKWITNCQSIPNGCIKEMARMFLKITDVRVERLQDISDEDCLKEGIYEIDDNDRTGKYKVYTIEKPSIYKGMILNNTYNSAFEAFEVLWDKVAPVGYKMKDNPSVFVNEFKRVNKVGSEI